MSEAPGDPPAFEPFEVDSSETIYDSSWCTLRRDQIRLPDGSLQEYHVFDVPSAVCVVPVLPDGSIVLLWQHRHPHGGTHWEVPAGRIDAGETPAQAAERELLEETGYRSDRLEAVCRFYPVNGISPHQAHVFVAHACQRVGDPAHAPAERMTVHVMGGDEVHERLRRGEFRDGFTSLALFHHFERRSRVSR